ncbi:MULTISPECIES: type II toxin-antitoxin system RelE/ParE family toxin [unclassified Caballeronia]|uniref:type II toxin-antitoxin system RelE/ParE family toxin n=1 Tax=unclassified Caballeronia TaxID=2646786 RepID=UPI002027F493|nr:MULTISPECIES: type II toxin-antitoxin system RelE/ParE family toxin [unclassified Caballeronia]MDR5772403.1 type II toxin-antitoxin system RelE/ParE family toxin [Caballeronia sp. LZ002]MDR5804152.1 type II toxin-antitoxin system RelE/ParE family toxin [Caballeronia sp. LZ001]MDR5847837.1 type II toxin-antitoxin system RelE/ParE family toxin [Caballeronia sp. LZ003]
MTSRLNIRTTELFDDWFVALKDRIAKRRIQARIDRLASGNPGDTNSAGSPVIEMRIDHGPGYRVYYVNRGDVLVILLCGGDKSTQDRDIKSAHAMLPHLDME